MAFGEIDSWRHKFLLSVKFLKVYVQKPWDNNIICRLLQGFWPTLREDGKILFTFGLHKENHIMLLDKNTEVKVRSPDGHTGYFDIVAGGQQGDTLAPYLFIICPDYELKTSFE